MSTIMEGREELFNVLLCDAVRSYIVDNFGKYANPEELSRFLVRHELLKMVQAVTGCIIEGGIKSGTGLFQFWQMVRMYSPDDSRKWIVGFDTFSGFPEPNEKDGGVPKTGDMKDVALEELWGCFKMHCMQGLRKGYTTEDIKLQASKMPVLYLMKGDFMVSGEEFLKRYPNVLVSLLFLDFDLYEPTKKALELFVPRMPKGSVLAMDDLSNHDYPGASLALLEQIKINGLELKKFPFNKDISYVVLQ